MGFFYTCNWSASIMKNYSKEVSLCDFPNEVWRDIQGYEGIYQVSNLGRVKSLGREVFNALTQTYVHIPSRIMRAGKGKNSRYYLVRLSSKGKQRNFSVHRLVAEAFILNPENKPQIDHIDGNTINNTVENLRWCTAKENCNNPLRLNKFLGANNHYFGKRHSVKTRQKMRLSHQNKVRNVKNISTNQIYPCIREAAVSVGVCKSAIKQAIYRHGTCAGCYWTYI